MGLLKDIINIALKMLSSERKKKINHDYLLKYKWKYFRYRQNKASYLTYLNDCSVNDREYSEGQWSIRNIYNFKHKEIVGEIPKNY